MPKDQRIDDAGGLVLESSLLPDAIDIWGDPVVEARLAATEPDGNLIARLCDVAPDGSSQLVCWGCLNLQHRNGNEEPEAFPIHESQLCQVNLDPRRASFPGRPPDPPRAVDVELACCLACKAQSGPVAGTVSRAV